MKHHRSKDVGRLDFALISLRITRLELWNLKIVTPDLEKIRATKKNTHPCPARPSAQNGKAGLPEIMLGIVVTKVGMTNGVSQLLSTSTEQIYNQLLRCVNIFTDLKIFYIPHITPV